MLEIVIFSWSFWITINFCNVSSYNDGVDKKMFYDVQSWLSLIMTAFVVDILYNNWV